MISETAWPSGPAPAFKLVAQNNNDALWSRSSRGPRWLASAGGA